MRSDHTPRSGRPARSGPVRQDMPVTLRSYRVSDLDAMVRLDELCFAAVFRFSRRAMRQFAERRGAIVSVAEEADAKMVGFLIVHMEGVRTLPANPFGYVVTIDVHPEARRKGLGEQMLREAEEQVRAAGGHAMNLHVARGNDAAIRFYERLGYRCMGLVEGFYGGGLDALVYGKRLER